MQSDSSIRRFGTFGGVFVPNILTILGVILFMRAGWVVGQAGLLQALLMLCVANAITLLTSLSLSAIATNARVEAGGAYHLISRSLGIEIGSSIGVPFFFAQSISVAFYLVGFTESLQPMLGDSDIRWVGVGTLGLIVLLAWKSSDLAIKAQYLILGIVGIALLSFFLGFSSDSQVAVNLQPQYSEGFHFWTVFAIYFPAVTGIMSGLSMSGELKDPARSIPRGTLVAVGVTFCIYAAQMVWLAHNHSRDALLSNPMVVWDSAVYGPAVYAGVWAATLSSAIASLLGAPRTLQALARDRVAPSAIAALSGTRGEPRRALVLSAVVAAICLAIGDLDTIAPIITMFFLSTYGMINFAAFVEGWSCNPSYRPKFKVHWAVSLIGALGSLGVMILLNAIATVIATVIIVALYLWLASRQFESAWGDSWSGFWFNMMRTALRKFAQSRQHIRNWRPVILVLSGNPATRHSLVSFAHHFECKRGYLFIARILVGDLSSRSRERDTTLATMARFIAEEGLTGESRVLVSHDFEQGVSALIQSTGVGPLAPNTVMLGWSGQMLDYEVYLNSLRRILELRMNLILHSEATPGAGALASRIDVWWGATVNGSLMLILAHLLRSNREWRDHQIRTLLIVRDHAEAQERRASLAAILEQSRIEAVCEVLVSTAAPLQLIQSHSDDAAVTFVGFNLDRFLSDPDAFEQEQRFLAAMRGHVFLTKNWQELEL